MHLLIYSVYDAEAKAWDKPIIVQSQVQATRAFKDEVNRESPGNNFHNYSEHFSLHYVGSFDTITGKIVDYDNLPKLVTTASAVKNPAG